ncbi:NAD(+) diphosphatase [Pararobbsia silviterrae]|uniref:NAD(+) diphosphatase n=1 Tax=Pararobbsia silviterrae TaxID=1792498 RepID=A0A494XCV1_9BURK|nr:NAD(+) diphosphatase [Pararobbsia silviterrae]
MPKQYIPYEQDGARGAGGRGAQASRYWASVLWCRAVRRRSCRFFPVRVSILDPIESALAQAPSVFDRSAAVGFGLNPLDRLSQRRDDDAFVDAKRQDASTRFMVLVGDVPVLMRHGDRYDVLFSRTALASLGTPVRDIFLGVDAEGAALFAVSLDAALAERVAQQPNLEPVDLRSIATRGLVPEPILGELGGAKAMLDWHARHRFCANCGSASRVTAAGWRRECDACGAQHFPRVDPVVIMLAIDGDRCLLGRQARFAPGMYSALAGFLEPGETIEDAVRREVHEEAGVHCTHVAYFASQPWPFPSSLMIGCFARAGDTEITVDTTELEDARWFTRDEVRAMLDGTHAKGLSAPKPFAIAHHLLKAFADNDTASLGAAVSA